MSRVARVFSRALLLLVALRIVAVAAEAPDLILTNGHIITVDGNFSIAQAVAIAKGRFTAVGTNADVEKLATPDTKRIDLHGQTVVPGLADGHLHDAGGGPGVDLSRARSIADVLAAIASRVRVSGPGDVIVTNSDWHEAQLAEHRLPYRKDLDSVAPVNPVVVVRGGHEYILNSAALAKWHITAETPPPNGGRISRDENGELDGELIDQAKSLVTLPPAPPLTIESLIEQHRKLNAAGLTSIRYPGASLEQYRLLQEMKRRGLLTVRVSQLMRPPADDVAKLRATIDSWSLQPDEGDEWLRIGGIKMAIDGGFEGGWMREPYAEPWGEGGRYRGVHVDPAVFMAGVQEVNRLGWRVATHAVGDAAIDLALDAYEAANADRPIAGRRWSIEHGFIPRDDQFPRMKALALVISAQDHLYVAGPSLVRYWGPARAAWTTPVRAYLDRGFIVAGGTDSPVVPYPPLWVVYHFVTRDTISGGVFGADQKISRREALQIETINNAYLTFEERLKGSIEPGKLADLVVLPEDILTCPEKDIEKMNVSMTMVGGKVVYERPGVRQSAPPSAIHDKDVPVPMRDGVMLRADVLRPSGDARSPTLVYRTPYGKHLALAGSTTFARAVERGYAVVVQDVRGRYASDGEFRPYQDEGRDGFDTIEWAARQPWSNGDVGTFGLSYPGAVQWLAAVEDPPHLKAMVPAMTFSTPRNFFYSWGVWDMSWIDWIWFNIAPDVRLKRNLPGPKTSREAREAWNESGSSMQAMLPLDRVEELRDVAPYYYEWLHHPPDDRFWDFAELRSKYGRVRAAVLNLSGWYDDNYGPEGATTNFVGLREARRGGALRSRLLIGPWVHGVESTARTKSGERDFGDTAAIDYDRVVLEWMDQYLRSKSTPTAKAVRYFVMGENRWRDADTWPPPATSRIYYLDAAAGRGRGGKLTTSSPQSEQSPSDIVSDPLHPVTNPYSSAGAHDYRALTERRDVLTFDSDPMTTATEVTGAITAQMYLSCDCRDTDLWVRLLDVAPDGTSFNLMTPGLDVLRASYRDIERGRQLLEPGRIYELQLQQLLTSNVFLKDHRIRVQISTTFFPNFSRNLHTGDLETVSAAAKRATIRIYHDARHASRLTLPVVVSESATASTAARSATARESRIAVGGASLYAREIGRGQPIVVLHGGPDFDTGYLLPELDQLADRFRLIYYDQRGRGRSADHVQPDDVTLASDVDDLDKVRQHFQLESPVLLGHSWGAVLALEYALRHPERVSQMILMNPAPASASDLAVFRKAYAEKLGADLVRQREIVAGTAYEQGDPEAVAARYRLHFKPALKRPEDYEKLMARMKAGFARQGKDGIVKARAVEDRLMRDTWNIEGYDLMPRLKSLSIPTLVITGDYDFIPGEIAAHIAASIPRARLVTLKDCGHFTYLECAGEVRRAIDEFVRNTPESSRPR